MRGQRLVHRSGLFIAARHRAVLEDAVVEQIDRAAFVHAEQGRIGLADEAAAGLREPDEFRELRVAHVGAYLPRRGEQRFGGEPAELNAAAETVEGLAFRDGVSLAHATHALRRHLARDLLVHLHQDETAAATIFGVLFQYRVGGGAGTGEGVEYQRIFVSGDLEDALNELSWLRR